MRAQRLAQGAVGAPTLTSGPSPVDKSAFRAFRKLSLCYRLCSDIWRAITDDIRLWVGFYRIVSNEAYNWSPLRRALAILRTKTRTTVEARSLVRVREGPCENHYFTEQFHSSIDILGIPQVLSPLDARKYDDRLARSHAHGTRGLLPRGAAAH